MPLHQALDRVGEPLRDLHRGRLRVLESVHRIGDGGEVDAEPHIVGVPRSAAGLPSPEVRYGHVHLERAPERSEVGRDHLLAAHHERVLLEQPAKERIATTIAST